ncbi:MAG TPA: DUF2071 domain-containing protein, partial [Lacunisphaera sp.]|nr:DUF2071 domain-containing protein [Lacunisphaera sp.]
FIAEYMDNLLSLKLGPPAFGLPYRFARLDYRHDWERHTLAGTVTGTGRTPAALTYAGRLDTAARFTPPEDGTLTEWLMERYTAFTLRRKERLFFRVWHPPWPKTRVDIKVTDDSLLRHDLPWFKHARFTGAAFSPGVRDVWMGRPRRLPAAA